MPLFTFALATLLSALATAVTIRVATALQLYDQPGGRRVHTSPVPRLGGVAVATSTLVALLAGLLLSGGAEFLRTGFLLGVVAGGVILFAAGIVDDLYGLAARTKLFLQILAALAVYAFGFQIEALTLGSQPSVSIGWLSLPVTVLWIVGVTNAYNLIDGLDGLATGLGIVTLATTLVAALLLGHPEVALAAAALLGALVGFLPFNFNPARIFLGDSGSLFVGFLLAVLSVKASTKSSTAVLVIVPVMALGLPLLDTLLAMARRWFRGIGFSVADCHHIHHRLLAKGLTTRRAVLLLYGIASAAAAVAVLGAFAAPQRVVAVTAVGAAASLALLFYGVRRLGYHEFEAAGHLAMRAPARLRKILRDRIYAQDIASLVRRASTLEELNAVLEDGAEELDLGHMEVCELDGGLPRTLVHARLGNRVWRVDYPLTSYDSVRDDWVVLRIWCRLDARAPNGSERVAAILGPVITDWIESHSIVTPFTPNKSSGFRSLAQAHS